MNCSLLTDRRVTGLHFARANDGSFDIEVAFNGRVFKRSGFETAGQAWRWACERVYGVTDKVAA